MRPFADSKIPEREEREIHSAQSLGQSRASLVPKDAGQIESAGSPSRRIALPRLAKAILRHEYLDGEETVRKVEVYARQSGQEGFGGLARKMAVVKLPVLFPRGCFLAGHGSIALSTSETHRAIRKKSLREIADIKKT